MLEIHYPLPSFVMLEIRRDDFEASYSIVLVDKKHKCDLDVEYLDYGAYPNQESVWWHVTQFKKELKATGVI